MTSKLLLSLAALGLLTTAALAQSEPLATAGVKNLALPIAPIQVKPSLPLEAYALDVMCQSAYVDEAIARCIAGPTPVAVPVAAALE